MVCVAQRSHETWLAGLVGRRGLQLIAACGLSIACGLSVACGRVTTPGGGATTDRGNGDPMSDRPGLTPMMNEPPMGARPDPDDGDEGVCEAVAVAGLDVTIEGPDADCEELRVVASAPSYAPDYEEELSCGVLRDACRCFGAHERPGPYRITVIGGEPPVELARSSLITVQDDDRGCHIETESVTLTLELPPPEADGGVVDAGGRGGDNGDGGARDGGR